jgi:hypothetical protein
MNVAPPDRNGQQDILPSVKARIIQPAGPENLARLESNLRRNQAALQHLLDLGLTPASVSKFHLGIKEPYRRKGDGKLVRHALCYPVISCDGEPLGRYGCCAIPGLTENPPDQCTWGRGKPLTYYSGSVDGKTGLVVAGTCQDLWAIDERLMSSLLADQAVVIAPSYGPNIPDEWKRPEFWSSWAAVYFAQGIDPAGERMARDLVRLCGREVFRVRVPESAGPGWVEFFKSGGTGEQFLDLLKCAQILSSPAPEEGGSTDQPGEFAANPVNINGAFVNGRLYYPFTVERRELERFGPKGGPGAERLVTSYVTKVIRSDGAVLDVVRLAAPRGTPRDRQVLALSDGTRIEKEPQPSHYATWHLDGIQEFIKAVRNNRPAPHRHLSELLADIMAHLRRSVWLPYDDDYTVLALYVALSFVYQVFDAVPLLMVRGDKGTGKSELGDAVARVSCNATIIGQGSAASVVRLLNEARGLVVLDDLESIGQVLEDAAFGDINQMLKLGYKKRTGHKAITDKNGKTTVFDFYGPKIINNTRGSDAILGSRAIHIQTRHISETKGREIILTGSDPDDLIRLRDELHAWGMASANLIYENYMEFVETGHARQSEIAAPLRTIAKLSGDDHVKETLEAALGRQYRRSQRTEDPVDLLREAISNCIREGVTEKLSASQLLLELRLLAEENSVIPSALMSETWLQPEWVGHQLRIQNVLKAGVKTKRIRLYGLVTRIYVLGPEYVRMVLGENPTISYRLDPLAFCEGNTCTKCRYDRVCETTIRGLKNAKRLNRGKSGRKTTK